MADSEQISAVLDEAAFHVNSRPSVAQGYFLTLSDVVAATQVVELQRIADSLEIMVSQGRHL